MVRDGFYPFVGDPFAVVAPHVVPTMPHDVVYRHLVFALIGDLNRRRGIGILLVEQNTHKALDLAERAYVLELGRKVMEGKPDELRDDPSLRDAYLGRSASVHNAPSASAASIPPGA